METIKKNSKKIVEETKEINKENTNNYFEGKKLNPVSKVGRDLYMKVQRILRNARIEKYMEDRDLISKEKLTFWGAVTGRNTLQLQRIENIKLKIELLEAQRIEEKNDYDPMDMLADIYSCAISELNGRFSEQMRSMYNQIKAQYCNNNVSDDDIYKLVCGKVEGNQVYLPIIHKENRKGILGNTKNQIEFFKVENKKLKSLILIERGKNQFEKIKRVIIPPLKNVSVV